MAPSRRQKRWSRPLRTAGALLLLLGAVAGADHVLGGGAGSAGAGRAGLYAGLAFAAGGAICFWLGRRWQ